MKSYLLKGLVLISSLFIIHSIVSAFITVNTVFTDINTDYKYFNELQELYNKQVFYPDENSKFNPNSLLRRDEFISVVMESSCNKCTKPNTSTWIIDNYKNSNPFFDITDTSNYFYCISLASDKNYFDSYLKWYKCDDWTINADKIPFCPNNYVSLEEAVSVILRNTNLYTVEENNAILTKITNWEITAELANDVSAKNTDWTAYKYYGYIKKALEYSFDEYDTLWIKKTYKLIDLVNWKVYPQKLISKEEFLKMAYIALKTNGCQNTVSSETTSSTVETQTTDLNCEENDSDDDWINNCDDLCADVYWKAINKWCPVYDLCNSDCTCSNGKVCSITSGSLCWIKWVCVEDTSKVSESINKTTDCLEKIDSSRIYGNILCDSWPCNLSLDFVSSIRKCDYLFPAITSWSGVIYSSWALFEVK